MQATSIVPDVEPWKRRLFLPAYTVADTARYAHTHPRTVTSWLHGDRERGPARPGKAQRKPLSYLQLVEVAFVATFRALGVPLQRIRKARDYLAQVIGSEFPFAEARCLTEGQHVLMDLQQIAPDSAVAQLVVANKGGQLAWQPLIGERFAQFDYDAGLAIRWFPEGRRSPVVIDPRVAFGAPTVRGVPTWTIKGRRLAGESIEDIRADFGLEPEEVVEALRFEHLEVAA